MNKVTVAAKEQGGTKMLEMLGPQEVIAGLVTLVTVAAREWSRVQLARERRREREQELFVRMVTEVTDNDGGVQVHHGGASGTWSFSSSTPERAGRLRTNPHPSSGGRPGLARWRP